MSIARNLCIFCIIQYSDSYITDWQIYNFTQNIARYNVVIYMYTAKTKVLPM